MLAMGLDQVEGCVRTPSSFIPFVAWLIPATMRHGREFRRHSQSGLPPHNRAGDVGQWRFFH